MEASPVASSSPSAVPAPAAVPAAPEPLRFGSSQRALSQRRGLVWLFKGLLLSIFLILALKFQPPELWAVALKWLAFGAIVWGLWQARGRLFMDALLERELIIHANALEMRRGSFRRFLVFESLRHIKVVQSPGGERLLSIRLDTEDDSLLLRGMDGLPEAFAAIAGAKPDRTLIEIDEQRIDWGEPLPWALAAGAAVLLLGWLLLGLWGTADVVHASGKLLLGNGILLAVWHPLSRGQTWAVRAGELGCLLSFAYLGYVLA
jgi:hypothetical protein